MHVDTDPLVPAAQCKLAHGAQKKKRKKTPGLDKGGAGNRGKEFFFMDLAALDAVVNCADASTGGGANACVVASNLCV